jgi:hypothetical protein
MLLVRPEEEDRKRPAGDRRKVIAIASLPGQQIKHHLTARNQPFATETFMMAYPK